LRRYEEVQDPERAPVAYFPGYTHLKPKVVEKTAWAPDEVQQRRQLLTRHALLITEVGALGVTSREDVAEIIGHHFDLLRYEF
jgi:hypothetical protein